MEAEVEEEGEAVREIRRGESIHYHLGKAIVGKTGEKEGRKRGFRFEECECESQEDAVCVTLEKCVCVCVGGRTICRERKRQAERREKVLLGQRPRVWENNVTHIHTQISQALFGYKNS